MSYTEEVRVHFSVYEILPAGTVTEQSSPSRILDIISRYRNINAALHPGRGILPVYLRLQCKCSDETGGRILQPWSQTLTDGGTTLIQLWNDAEAKWEVKGGDLI